MSLVPLEAYLNEQVIPIFIGLRMNSTDKSDAYRTLFQRVPENLNALYFSLLCHHGKYIDLAPTVE